MGPHSEAAPPKQGLLPCRCHHWFQAEPGWQKPAEVLREAEGKGRGGRAEAGGEAEGEVGVRLSRGWGGVGSRQRGDRKGGWGEAEERQRVAGRRQKPSGYPLNLFLVPFKICKTAF